MSTAISIENLSKKYGKLQVLENMSLDVPHGSIFGFLGPNGAGKSTTIKILAGLSHATSGRASINGVPVTRTGLHRRHLGYVAQEPRFYGWMSGREVLEYAASFHPGIPKQRIDNLLERVGIANAANRPCSTYSGGMRQRLGIAQALIAKPTVVILDEPVSAMDSVGRAEVLELMRDLRGETTIFYSTHILEDVQRLSDYVAILNQGKLVKTAPTKELLSSFSKGSLRVTLRGANETITEALKQLPGILNVSVPEQHGNMWVYNIQANEEWVEHIQRLITRFAAERNLALITNEPLKMELETVFLQLISANTQIFK
jgi:ABC-2 type transport system ATP-binding protein